MLAFPDPGQLGFDSTLSRIAALFQTEPGVGFTVCDRHGGVIYLNQRAAELFLRGTPAQATGRTLEELFGKAWAAERLELFRRTLETGRPIISRHILHGVQIQSTIRVLSHAEDADPVFSIMTTTGEHDPPDPEAYDIVESGLAHFGPLDPLTRREIEVLALIGHGMTSPQIAAALHRSVRTIEQHCDSIRNKLKGATRVQIADFARRACLEIDDAKLKRI
jgi:DNA-binding CsgD family transcriptional regulator